jgi:two-component system NtrC family sensor kinase
VCRSSAAAACTSGLGRCRALGCSSCLRSYLTLTGLSVLLFSYVALTYLIVRPLDRLTLSAQQLAQGGEPVRVREQGAAEVAQLAHTFNRMAVLLKAEQKRLVERLQELERTTEALAHKEQQLIHGEKLASIGRLAAGVAHEIGNPLAAILGLLDLLRDGDLTESETREFLGRIHRETERINHIIRDLLDFARRDVQLGSDQVADLGDVIQDAVGLVRPQKESRTVTIETFVDEAAAQVAGPAPRLLQVVLNLLLNAIDAMQGRGRIVVRVVPCEDEAYAKVQVEDDGPGIAEDMLDKLFEPFTTTKPAGRGTGLGLAVTAAIIDGLSGTIVAKNRPEGGALFELRLPRAKSSALPPAAREGV